MSEIERIASLLEETFEGKPYYGLSVLGTLQQVTAAVAAFTSTENTHSIWAIVTHLTAELNYVHDMIEGTVGSWIEGETTWPEVIGASETSWQQAIHSLKEANRALVRRVKMLNDNILSKQASPARRPFYVMLHGTIQHSVYHAGQIALLKNHLRRRRENS